jgi:hypothetical protein
VRRIRNHIVHNAPEIAESESEEDEEADIEELPSIPGDLDERLIEVLDRVLAVLESLFVDSKLLFGFSPLGKSEAPGPGRYASLANTARHSSTYRRNSND